MKDILIDGHRVLTTDDVAEAVIGYARVLRERGANDIIDFPSVHDGQPAICSLLLGGAATLAIVEAPLASWSYLDGAPSACEEIVRRTQMLGQVDTAR